MSTSGHSGLVLNLAGEGESVGAVDINNLILPRLPPTRWARPGRFIKGDITALPVRGACVLEVIGTRCR